MVCFTLRILCATVIANLGGIIMKRYYHLCITVLTVFVILGILVGTVNAATLNITVTDAQTGNKLNSVSITVKPETGNAMKGITDSDGVLALSDIPAGIYSISQQHQDM